MRPPLMSAVDEVSVPAVWEAAEADFSTFYTVNQPRLVGALVLYTGDRELALDLAQEALARAYRDWRSVSAMEAPGAWLHRVAFNLAKSSFRRKMVEFRSAVRQRGHSELPHIDPDPGDSDAVRRLVASLPRRQKTALLLRYYADLSVEAVAEIMGCAEGTVRALTSQALANLRRSDLARDLGERS